MRVRADEHVSPEIVEAVCRLCLSDGWQFDHVYDAGDQGAADEHWITRFAKTGGHAILSADRDFTSKHAQVVAVFDTGLRVIHLPGKWGAANGNLQAAHILIWWPRIETKIQEMRPRECYRPEWNVSGETGVFKKVEMNFAEAQKKHRKAARRTI